MLQIIADVCDIPVYRPSAEGAIVGAAIVAGTGVGLFPSVEAGVKQMVHIVEEYHPDPGSRGIYDRSYALFKEIFEEACADTRTQRLAELGRREG